MFNLVISKIKFPFHSPFVSSVFHIDQESNSSAIVDDDDGERIELEFGNIIIVSITSMSL